LAASARPTIRANQRLHVVAYDFGIKRNILRLLADYGCRVTVVPAQTGAAEVLELAPDGVFSLQRSGDPEPCDYAIRAVQDFLKTDLPVFGICLGHQILGLASGARTVKMNSAITAPIIRCRTWTRGACSSRAKITVSPWMRRPAAERARHASLAL